MPQIGVFVAIGLLLFLALISLVLGVIYFRATGDEAKRRSRVREAVQAQRRARQRPPLLSDVEVPQDPAELLRSQKTSLRNRIRRR